MLAVGCADASYQVVDANGNTYGDGNPRLCPTYVVSDNPPTFRTDSTAWTTTAATKENVLSWTYPATTASKEVYVWGFKLTILAKDAESEEFSPLDGWNGALLRTYIDGEDGFKDVNVKNQGLVCDTQAASNVAGCVLTFSDVTDGIKPASGLTVPPFNQPTTEISKFRFELMVINLNGVASSMTPLEVDNV